MITKRQISIKVGYTYNLGDYSNIRPEVMVSGEIPDSEPFAGVVKFLQDEALSACYDLIDAHLEKMGQPAKFSEDPRFSAQIWGKDNLILLMPEDVFKRYVEHFRTWNHHNLEGYRREHLYQMLQKRYPDYKDIREFAEMPPVQSVPQRCFVVETDKAIFLGKGNWSDLPVYIRKFQHDYDQTERLWSSFLDEITEKAEALNKTQCVVNPKDEDEILSYVLAEELKARYDEEQAAKAQKPEPDPFLCVDDERFDEEDDFDDDD